MIAHDVIANKTFRCGMTVKLFISTCHLKLSIPFIIHAQYIYFRLCNQSNSVL